MYEGVVTVFLLLFAMENNKLTRQEIYDKIKESSKDAYILSEMKKLGFWNGEEIPEVFALIEEEAALMKELNKIQKEAATYEDPEKLLKQIKKERLKASREQQKRRKEERLQLQEQKRLVYKESLTKDILYIGDQGSKSLDRKENNKEVTIKTGVPPIEHIIDLSKLLKTSVSELRFLAYNKKVNTVSHYKRFYVPKKSGGKRLISAPMPRLKRIQYAIKETILDKVGLTDFAHGFVAKRSIVSNAKPHVGKDVVLNLDLKDFFPSLDYKRVKGMFVSFGYAEQIATLLGLLCTEPQEQMALINGEKRWIQTGNRFLPQGAPTSPVITNIICRKLDKRLSGIARKRGFEFTRYADDITFSGNAKSHEDLSKLLWVVKKVVTEEGFTVHPDKTHIMRKHQRQEVTGVVVNDKLSVSRKKVRNFKALLKQIEESGFENKHWNGIEESAKLMESVKGYADFLAMIMPEGKGKVLQQKTYELLKAHNYHFYKKPKKKKWWKFW